MSEQKIVISDEILIEKLKNNSQKLNISENELIERYIRRGILCKRKLSEVI